MIINHINKYLINLFSDITNDLNLNNPQFRILKESQYFEIYLKFLSNSTYFSRFSYDIKIVQKLYTDSINTLVGSNRQVPSKKIYIF